MMADTAQSVLIGATCLAILAFNLWNARRLDRKHQQDGS